MSDTFKELLTRYDMGQAYITITETMGPSPQLVAFVNYENVTNESLGLESFEIMTQHDQILAQINTDPALELAVKLYMESKTGDIEASIATEGLFRSLFSKVGNYGAWTFDKRYIATILAWYKHVINTAPSGTKLADWEKYQKQTDEYVAKASKEIDAANGQKIRNPKENHDGKVRFAKSGWNKERYEAEMKWVDDLDAKNKEFLKANEAKIEKLKALAAKADDSDDTDEVKAAKIMRSVVIDFNGLQKELAEVAGHIRKRLAPIAKHLD